MAEAVAQKGRSSIDILSLQALRDHLKGRVVLLGVSLTR